MCSAVLIAIRALQISVTVYKKRYTLDVTQLHFIKAKRNIYKTSIQADLTGAVTLLHFILYIIKYDVYRRYTRYTRYVYAYVRAREQSVTVFFFEGGNIMREAEIENRLKNGIRQIGGRCYKFVSPGNDGVPDRIVVLPGGQIVFVELKTETGRLSPLQRIQITRLQELGTDVRVLKGLTEVNQFLEEMK